MLRTSKYHRIVTSLSIIQSIYSLIDVGERKGNFQPKSARLLIERSDHGSIVLVDDQGHILTNGRNYALSPHGFVALNNLVLGGIFPEVFDKEYKQTFAQMK